RAIRLSPLDPLGGYFSGGLAVAYAVAGQYDAALVWADRALHEIPGFVPVIRSKVVCYVQLGRLDEARTEVKRLVDVRPGVASIAEWHKAATRYFAPQVLTVYLNSFRQAGMPEV